MCKALTPAGGVVGKQTSGDEIALLWYDKRSARLVKDNFMQTRLTQSTHVIDAKIHPIRGMVRITGFRLA